MFVVRYIILLSMLLAAMGSKAQYASKVGAKLRYVSSNQHWSYSQLPEGYTDWSGWQTTRSSFGISAFAELGYHERFKWNPQLTYMRKGFEKIETLSYQPIDPNVPPSTRPGEVVMDVVTDYISIDLLSRTNLSLNSTKPYLLAGFRPAYLMNSEVRATANGSEVLITDTLSYAVYYQDALKDYNAISLGLVLGFGIEFSDVLLVEFEYNPDITRAAGIDNSSTKLNITNQAIGFNIGVNLFNLWEE